MMRRSLRSSFGTGYQLLYIPMKKSSSLPKTKARTLKHSTLSMIVTSALSANWWLMKSSAEVHEKVEGREGECCECGVKMHVMNN